MTMRALPLLAVIFLGACSSESGPTATFASLTGSWSTTLTVQTTMNAQLVQTGTSVTGTGTLGVTPAIAPNNGAGPPNYGGDNFKITSGTFSSPDVSFTASLGSNSNGAGGVYLGTLSFTGTVSGSTMSGTVTYTPPRTITQTFAPQTATGVVLTQSANK